MYRECFRPFHSLDPTEGEGILGGVAFTAGDERHAPLVLMACLQAEFEFRKLDTLESGSAGLLEHDLDQRIDLLLARQPEREYEFGRFGRQAAIPYLLLIMSS